MNSARKHFEVSSKLTIANLINLFNPNKNLLTGAKDFSGDWTIYASYHEDGTYKGMKVYKTTSAWSGINCIPVNVGETYTYAATIKNTFGAVLGLQLWSLDKNQLRLEYLGHSNYIDNGIEKQIAVTATIKNANTKYLQFGVYSDNTQQNTHSFQVKNERLYLGEAPGIWTPNPADKVGGVVNFVLTAAFERRCAA